MILARAHCPYTILELQKDVASGPKSVVNLVLKEQGDRDLMYVPAVRLLFVSPESLQKSLIK